MNESYDVLFWFFFHGGTVSKESFYDEEGVDGWKWIIDEVEVNELGGHEIAPILPDDILEHMKTRYKVYPL